MEILIIIALILLNGIFSMSELALVSTKKFKLESAIKKGDKNAKNALDLANNPTTFLSTVQIGITLIGILTGIFSGKNLSSGLATQLKNIEILAPYADSIALLSIVIIVTYLSIVFGELIPKRVGLHYPERIAGLVATPMILLSKISLPIIWLLTKTSNLFFKLLRIEEKERSAISEDEINAIIQESTEGGEVQPIEQDLVKRVFALGDRRAGELMTHRKDLVWIDVDDDLEIIRNKVNEYPHSFYPLAKGSLDNLLGFISIRSIFLHRPTDSFHTQDYMKNILYVSEYTAAYRVLEQLRLMKQRQALVLDEYGDLQGLIAINDILDELISDQAYEDDDYKIVQRDDDTWLADGQLPIFEFAKYFNEHNLTETGSFTTLGGLILHISEHIPSLAEKIKWKGFEFEIVDMDGLRIDKILVRRIAKQ